MTNVKEHAEFVQKVKAEIERRLKSHPGDAPWGCVECYHGRPCIDREILMAAKAVIK